MVSWVPGIESSGRSVLSGKDAIQLGLCHSVLGASVDVHQAGSLLLAKPEKNENDSLNLPNHFFYMAQRQSAENNRIVYF